MRPRRAVRVGVAVLGNVPGLPVPVVDAAMERALAAAAADEDAEQTIGLSYGLLLSGVEGGEMALRCADAIDVVSPLRPHLDADAPLDELAAPLVIKRRFEPLRSARASELPPSYAATRDWFVTRSIDWHDLGQDWQRLVVDADHIVLLMPDDDVVGRAADYDALLVLARRHGHSVTCIGLDTNNTGAIARVVVHPSRARAATRARGQDEEKEEGGGRKRRLADMDSR